MPLRFKFKFKIKIKFEEVESLRFYILRVVIIIILV